MAEVLACTFSVFAGIALGWTACLWTFGRATDHELRVLREELIQRDAAQDPD